MHPYKALALLPLCTYSYAQGASGNTASGVGNTIGGIFDGINEAINNLVDGAAGPDSKDICNIISRTVSEQSQVVYPQAVSQYKKDIRHYMSSSTLDSQCVVEIGSNEDAAITMRLLGDSRTQFAIKSGGHASNQGYSSTEGVLIYLNRMKDVQVSADKSVVKVGMGNLWTEAYDKMNGTGLQLNGGRVSGPGTGGFTLGGGYSWFVNQYGLTCDTVDSYTLVLPTGNLTKVDVSTPDLFFALKGGMNRFGLVTETTYKPFVQDYEVYGGVQLYPPEAVPALINATQKFYDEDADPKAQVILTLNSGLPAGAILLVFYDGPNPGTAFAPYDGIEPKPIINGLKKQSYAAFASSTPSNLQAGRRGAFHTLTTSGLTIGFQQAAWAEAQKYKFLEKSGFLFSYDIEPFSNSYGRHATDSAYPHANGGLPLNLYFAWGDKAQDKYWRGEMQASIDRLTQVAKDEGIYDEGLYAYPNYALSTYTAEQLYGEKNTRRLRAVREAIDPQNVMGLTGGFKI